MEFQRRDDVGTALGLAALQEGDAVRMCRQIRQQIGEPRTGLAILLPGALGRIQRAHPTVGCRFQVLGKRIGQGLTMQPDEFGLVVKQVQRAWCAGHVQPDHRLGLGRVMRLLGRERIHEICRTDGRDHAPPGQHAGDGQAAQTIAGIDQEVSA
ncbi:hypothetical protein SDC9_199949 [bioreactor metagenome]|uniref:Uncharacterized protein n=1 Tax=bioreactor metagenome TaxID=1076179 RepID=A0A645IYJ7_9ZZZZ